MLLKRYESTEVDRKASLGLMCLWDLWFTSSDTHDIVDIEKRDFCLK